MNSENLSAIQRPCHNYIKRHGQL